MQWKFVYEALCLAVELCMEYMLPQVEWKRSSGATTIRIDSLQPVLYVCMYVCTYVCVYICVCMYLFFFEYGLLLAPLLLYNRNTTSI